MSRYTSQSDANKDILDHQTHKDIRRGQGVISLITQADIAKRAYEIYIKNGRKQGNCEQDWFKAEDELREEKHLQ